MRKLLSAALLALSLVAPNVQAADPYPAKPIRLIIPFPPGGGAEGAARLVANHLSQALGQPVVLEPRPGGGTVIGTQAVAKAEPDGYTLLMTGGSTMTIQPFVFAGKLPFDPLVDFAPISMVSRFPFFVVVPSELPARSLKELVDLAKTRSMSYGSNGSGSIAHLGTEMLKQRAGIELLHVPYKGFAPILPDLISGRVSMMMADIAPIREQVRAGRLRVLAATSVQRSQFMPDVPTVAEAGYPGYEVDVWFGLYAPAKTPPSIVARLGEETRKYLASSQAKADYAKLGHETAPSTPEEVRARIVAEQKQYSAAVKIAKLKPE